jgi:hypothetical protein
MAIKISAKSTKQLSSGSSFRAAGKSGTSILNAVPKKGSFASSPKPASSVKIGTYKGSSLTVGVGRSSASSTDRLFAQIPKPTTRTITFKTTPPETLKAQKPGVWSTPKLTITPYVAPVKSPVKSSTKSSSGGSGSGDGKVVSIKQDSANKYFQANPGARAKDYVGQKLTIQSVKPSINSNVDFSTGIKTKKYSPSTSGKTLTTPNIPNLNKTMIKTGTPNWDMTTMKSKLKQTGTPNWDMTTMKSKLKQVK